MYNILFRAVLIVICCATTSYAQPGGGDAIRAVKLGLGILEIEQVQEDLKITDQQLEKISDIVSKFREDQKAYRAAQKKLDKAERDSPEKKKERLKEAKLQREKKIAAVMSPRQNERLKEIQFQLLMKSKKRSWKVYETKDFQEMVGVTKEEIDALKEKAKEVEERLKKEIAVLREKAQKEIFSVLSMESLTNIEELNKEPFELDLERLYRQFEFGEPVF